MSRLSGSHSPVCRTHLDICVSVCCIKCAEADSAEVLQADCSWPQLCVQLLRQREQIHSIKNKNTNLQTPTRARRQTGYRFLRFVSLAGTLVLHEDLLEAVRPLPAAPSVSGTSLTLPEGEKTK